MLKGGKRSNYYFILALPIMVVFFYSIYPLTAFVGDVVINEIAWMGNLNSSYDEWIELKNLTGNNISLEGWTLVAQDGSPSINLIGSISSSGFFILERSDDDSALGVTADLIYIGALGNTGEILELRDENGNLVDSLDNGSGWVGGDSDTKQTTMRDENGNWATSEDVGGTPKAQNVPIITPSESNNENSDGGDIATSTTSNNEETESLSTEETESDSVSEVDGAPDNNIFSLGDVAINEFVSDPADEEVEWIELYNNLDIEVDLEDWTLEDGSSAITKLAGVIGISGNNRYFVLEKPKGNLNNKGDIIVLRDSLGKLIDKVTYGNWDDGDINDNAPYATDPNSIARKINGYSSFNNKNDFALTTVLTKGSANIIKGEEREDEEEISAEDKSNYDYSDDILISEIYPNPIGPDSEDEFIELFNKGSRDVNLTGWKLGDSSKKRFEIKVDGDSSRDSSLAPLVQNDSFIIKGGGSLVIYRSESGIALNNTSDSVKLFKPLEDMAFEVVEYDDVIEGWSYNRKLSFRSGEFEWSEIITPGEENVIKFKNKAPEVSIDWPESGVVGVPILFDSSDTIDEENDKLSFFWDFGDGITNILASPEHTYFKVGAFTIALSVSDGENEVEEERIIVVKSNEETESLSTEKRERDSVSGDVVVINEILPNPEGTDSEGEWIEIKNMGIEKVNLLNWIIDDSEGGSKPFKFNSDLWLEPGGLYTLDRVDSNIALNNSVDSVRLYSDLEELIDEIEYEKVVEGESYAKGENGKLFWTSVLTPGEDNTIKLGSLKTLNTYEDTEVKEIKEGKKNIEPLYISFDKMKDAESGDTVITKGVVSVLPGILGTQYFYISYYDNKKETESLSAEKGESDSVSKINGIQVYNYNKDFPDLRVGDYIEVIGEIGVTYGEKRIKTKVKEDMVILERGKEIEVKEYSCIDVNEEIIGSLIMVKGEIVERKSSVVYLDDGTDEVRLYIKSTTGINLKSLEEGGVISATGIVGMTKSGIRIMPRSPEDIIRGDIESSEDTVGQVLGEVSVSDEWEIAKRDKKLELFKYVLVIASTLIIILGYLLFREIRK